MTASDPRAEERIGSVLHDKWTLERLLGVGGMGAVYAARHRNGARAAVKVLSPAMGRLPHIRKRFIQEGYAANRVEHAGAVKVLDDDVIQEGADEGTAYLVMELLEGEALGDRAKKQPPLTEHDLLVIAEGVLAVLAAAHANGVVHRDLKPDNLFLARDPDREGVQIKVLDFGLARLLEAQEQTIAGMALGTPTYMSPEQASGKVAEIDGRTDIYALGSILFQLATNRRIHDAAHTLGLVVRMATTPAPKVRTVAPDVSEAFARVVDRALEFRREDRYPDASAMLADVRDALAAVPTEGATLELASGPASRPAPSVPKGAAFLDTVRVPAAAASAASPSLPRALKRGQPNEGNRESTAPRRSSFGRLVFFALVAAGAFFGWTKRAEVERLLGDAPAPPAASSPEPSNSAPPPPPVDAAPPTPVDAAPPDEEPAAVLLDASAEEPDASVDAGDAGEDDDEDDEEEELLDASADAAPSLAGPKAPRRAGGASSVVKPRKKHPPRRPGTRPPWRRRRH
jgi:serine/threonine-protein kinase